MVRCWVGGVGSGSGVALADETLFLSKGCEGGRGAGSEVVGRDEGRRTKANDND